MKVDPNRLSYSITKVTVLSFHVTSNSSPEYKLMNVVIKQSFWLKTDGPWDQWSYENKDSNQGATILIGEKFNPFPTWQHF